LGSHGLYVSCHVKSKLVPHRVLVMRLSTVSALFFATVASVYAADASDVLDLTASNFEEKVNPQDLILVEFFAPWYLYLLFLIFTSILTHPRCGHCKALAPRYEEAATSLKPKGIPLAKVDCVEQSELCKSHGVSGYPLVFSLAGR
jgi:protein disulfide-isomerase A1